MTFPENKNECCLNFDFEVDLADIGNHSVINLLMKSLQLDESSGIFNDDDSENYYTYSDIYKNSDDSSSDFSVILGVTNGYHNKRILTILQTETNSDSIIEEIEVIFLLSEKFYGIICI